jgi:putative glycosyltransferase (TIGR04372 family)
VGYAAAVPAALGVRLLAPLVRVRIGRLPSDRFGHFVINTEVYLCDRDAVGVPRRVVDVFYHATPVSNLYLAAMWARHLRINAFWGLVHRVLDWMGAGAPHTIPLPPRDLHGNLAVTPPHLEFTADEAAAGRAATAALGVPDGMPFVCFNARDAAYTEAWFPGKKGPRLYHDSEIEHYLPMAEEMVRRGYAALRMGSVVKRPLAAVDPRIIDYATRGRTEFMDLYLAAHCRFFLGASGITMLPMIFRRPVALVNFIPLAFVPAWNPWDIVIPKTLWLRRERRLLRFAEILHSDIGRNIRYPHDDAGIEVLENTPEEILALAVEMDDRLRGTWRTTDEDEELQRRFWALWGPDDLNRVFRARIGAQFLREHRALLG